VAAGVQDGIIGAEEVAALRSARTPNARAGNEAFRLGLTFAHAVKDAAQSAALHAIVKGAGDRCERARTRAMRRGEDTVKAVQDAVAAHGISPEVVAHGATGKEAGEAIRTELQRSAAMASTALEECPAAKQAVDAAKGWGSQVANGMALIGYAMMHEGP